MIPLKDETPTSRFAFANYAIVAANVAVFLYQAHRGERVFEAYVNTFGLTPATVAHGARIHSSIVKGGIPSFVTCFTAMFMHGSFFHLLSNMWFLFIFGDNVEDAMGRFRYLIFYLLTGLIASFTHIAVNPSSTMPLVGASGAIAGVLGGYFLLFPRHRILTLLWIFFFVRLVHIPAFFFLGLWFLIQVVSSTAGGGIAWFAHIGGFLSGMLLVRFFVPERSTRT